MHQWLLGAFSADWLRSNDPVSPDFSSELILLKKLTVKFMIWRHEFHFCFREALVHGSPESESQL